MGYGVLALERKLSHSATHPDPVVLGKVVPEAEGVKDAIELLDHGPPLQPHIRGELLWGATLRPGQVDCLVELAADPCRITPVVGHDPAVLQRLLLRHWPIVDPPLLRPPAQLQHDAKSGSLEEALEAQSTATLEVEKAEVDADAALRRPVEGEGSLTMVYCPNFGAGSLNALAGPLLNEGRNVTATAA
eukprot:CAMPEP_0180799936 /NCGR_PEP_ID=MMETSP1038_2-20121128/58825_1 /TAXON_ID=632150 /ORGANISM="Azadinium spinosum, Strain 3D9" /LENGTH=188 /DNA_ID=CAMNT_0022839609 /DNA_START=1 /DNA_END=565 /DNA_ORIENTATION=+